MYHRVTGNRHPEFTLLPGDQVHVSHVCSVYFPSGGVLVPRLQISLISETIVMHQYPFSELYRSRLEFTGYSYGAAWVGRSSVKKDPVRNQKRVGWRLLRASLRNARTHTSCSVLAAFDWFVLFLAGLQRRHFARCWLHDFSRPLAVRLANQSIQPVPRKTIRKLIGHG